VAHELGPHVQKLTGIEGKVRQLQESNSREVKPLSVKLELQADCLAGVWAHSTQQRGLLEKGDVESALGAASAVGDDRLQKCPPAMSVRNHLRMDFLSSGCIGSTLVWKTARSRRAILLDNEGTVTNPMCCYALRQLIASVIVTAVIAFI
jgi:hypothetical protein